MGSIQPPWHSGMPRTNRKSWFDSITMWFQRNLTNDWKANIYFSVLAFAFCYVLYKQQQPTFHIIRNVCCFVMCVVNFRIYIHIVCDSFCIENMTSGLENCQRPSFSVSLSSGLFSCFVLLLGCAAVSNKNVTGCVHKYTQSTRRSSAFMGWDSIICYLCTTFVFGLQSCLMATTLFCNGESLCL